MLIEHNRSYEARFLGREVLTAAVTSELLCRLVHQLPETVQEGSRCTVSCSATGLSVSRTHQDGSVHSILRVPLSNILFCHVDKARPEVTVWVVRTRDSEDCGSGASRSTPHSNSGQPASGTVLSAYVYKCLNPSDAVGLFNVYNEMNRQTKLDKYRRNVEKKEDGTATTTLSEPNPAYRDVSKDSDSDDSHAGSSSGVSSGSNTSLDPVTMAKAGDRPEVRSWTRPQQNGSTFDHYKSPATWVSIADSIENYRRSFSVLRPKDKEVRAAVLQELREKLRARYGDRELDVQSKQTTTALPSQASNSTWVTSGSKQLASNRQRKPAKVINESEGTVPMSKSDKQTPNANVAVSTPSSCGSIPASKVLPFPFSMGNMMKKLVQKNRSGKQGALASGSRATAPPVNGPLWMLSEKGSINPSPLNPIANHSPTRKFKYKKGPAPLPPQPNIPPRMASNGVDPFFYLPPVPRNLSTKGTPPGANHRTDLFVPVLPQAWIHHHRLSETAIPGGKDVRNGRATKIPSNGDPLKRSSISNPKKKVLAVHGLSRLARAYKKRMPHGGATGIGAFVRSSSTTSHGSSSSCDSGPDGKLRSVMKKPKDTRDNNSPPEQKKNVTFHAYATVQVLP